MTDNADQIAYWNAASGHKWAEDAEKLDAMMAEMAAVAIAAASPRAGESVVDIGCGAGATAVALANAVGPEGRVLGVDVSAPMLEVARARGAGRGPLSFVEADAATAHFAAASADLVFSKFGVMFFVDPEAAFRNIRKVVKPGGRLAFICWRTLKENPFATLPMGAALKHLPPQPSPDPNAPGPFAFADPVRVGHILTAAGFQTPAFAHFDSTMTVGRTPAAAAKEAVLVGMASRLLANEPQAMKDQVIAELTEIYERHVTPAGVTVPAACWVVTASA
ncbi:2-methoxy-6-polyprenyl-1,4-benzoquinol methylase, mitochondrial [Alphaproteobacteria bacterium SO-S41]|nr:2-methoxy-6-polyprenyl-1,4-benzoquinol methylase, mitochondrial [Alphaproteobacteria bacterium SO-S41]